MNLVALNPKIHGKCSGITYEVDQKRGFIRFTRAVKIPPLLTLYCLVMLSSEYKFSGSNKRYATLWYLFNQVTD